MNVSDRTTENKKLLFFYVLFFPIALKRKLQVRRSLKQLVDVGIMPPPKAPLPFYEQRKQLQMRKVIIEIQFEDFFSYLFHLDTGYNKTEDYLSA